MAEKAIGAVACLKLRRLSQTLGTKIDAGAFNSPGLCRLNVDLTGAAWLYRAASSGFMGWAALGMTFE
jgi:hypothetical protein